MGARPITEATLRDHVRRLQDEHPPIRLDSVDRTIHDPQAVRERFATTIDYLARVELEVERNVLELLTIMPETSEVDRFFYSDVWNNQEIAHGQVLDRMKLDLGMAPAEPYHVVPFQMKLLGAMAHLGSVQDISRMMYYLTGAATERQAVVAYSGLMKALDAMDEHAMSRTIVHPIKQQEPGHYAFYMMSATRMVQDRELRPWQLFVVRELRRQTMSLVGTDEVDRYRADMGGVLVELGFDADLAHYAREIGRFEAKLLWAHRQGMDFPPYFLTALRESVEMYRERGSFERGASRRRPAGQA